MKRLPNYWVLCQIFLLISFLLVSTNLIASPYPSVSDHEEHVHGMASDQHRNVKVQFNRMQDPVNPSSIDLSRDDLKVLPILLVPSNLKFFNQATEYHNQGDLVTAIEQYQNSIDEDNKWGFAYFNLAIAYASQGDLVASTNAYNNAVDVYKDQVDTITTQARSEGYTGEIDPDYIAPNFAPTYINLGHTYSDLELWQQAIDAYQKALEINPKLSDENTDLAKIYADQDDQLGAINKYQQTFEIYPLHQYDIDSKIDEIKTQISQVRSYFQDQMETAGYLSQNGEGKTFDLVKGSTNSIYVYQHFSLDNISTFNQWSEQSYQLINNIYPQLTNNQELQSKYPEDRTLYYVVMLDADYTGGIAMAGSTSSGICVVSTQNFNSALTVHELGHAFGIGEHDWRASPSQLDDVPNNEKYYLMGYRWWGKWFGDMILSDLSTAILNGSPFFNRNEFNNFDLSTKSSPQIEITSSNSYPPASEEYEINFTVNDNSGRGIYMVAFYGQVDLVPVHVNASANGVQNGDRVPISNVPNESFLILNQQEVSTSISLPYQGSYSFGTHLSASDDMTDSGSFYSVSSSTHQNEERHVFIMAMDRTGRQKFEKVILRQSDKAKLVFSSPAQAIFVNHESELITIQLQMPDGSEIEAVEDFVIELNTDSETGDFLDPEDVDKIVSSVTINRGESEITFLYRDTTTGDVVLEAKSAGDQAVEPSIQKITINGLASTISVESDDDTYYEGQDIILKISTRNDSDMIAPSLGEVSVTLEASSGKLDPESLTLGVGETEAFVTLSENLIGDFTVTASSDNLGSVSFTATVIPTVGGVDVSVTVSSDNQQASDFKIRLNDTVSEVISSAVQTDDIITVKAFGQPGQSAFFNISDGFATEIEMVESDPGTYTGEQLLSGEITDGRYDLTVTIGTGETNSELVFDGPLAFVPDPDLRSALESALGKGVGAVITDDELDELTEIDATNLIISDLTGIESCTNLVTLDLTGSTLSYNIYSQDIEELENRGLTVKHTKPEDHLVTTVNGVLVFIPDKYLQYQLSEELNLDRNQLIPLVELRSLERLEYRSNSASQKIKTLSGLGYCENLTYLDLSQNSIDDISELRHLHKLSELALYDNNIRDIDSLTELANLKELQLNKNQIRNISPLTSNQSFADGDYLVLTENPLSNVSYTHLITKLRVRGVTVIVEDVVNNVIVFKDQNLEGQVRSVLGGITEFLTIANTSGLVALSVEHAEITDLTGLNELPDLTSLIVNYNPLSQTAVSVQIPHLQASGVDVIFGVAIWSFGQQGSGVSVFSKPENSGFMATLHGSPSLEVGLGRPAIHLDGTKDWVEIPNHEQLNTGGPWSHKTIVATFKAEDTSIEKNKQVIYEQGSRIRGLNLYIHKGRLYVGGYNRESDENNWQGNWVSVPIVSNKWYQVAIVLRGGTDRFGDGRIELWLNGKLVSSEPAARVHGDTGEIGLGKVNQSTWFHDGTGEEEHHFFAGLIDSVYIYNSSLSKNRLEEMTVDPLDSLSVGWKADQDRPKSITVGTGPLTQPLGQLIFSSANSGGAVQSISWNLLDKTVSGNNSLVNPSAIKLYGYIGDKNSPPITATLVDDNVSRRLVFELSSPLDLSVSSNEPEVSFHIDLEIDHAQLDSTEKKELVAIDLSLNNIETTAVGGLSQSYDEYGQPKGHRWRDELQPALDSPLEIRIELVKKQPLTVSPKFVELRYQADGVIQMYDSSTDNWVAPRLVLTNETSLEKTYSLEETDRVSQPSLVSLTPADDDSNNPLPAGSVDIDDIRTLFTDDDLTVEISYSGTLTHHQNQKVVGQILIDTGRPDNTMSAPPASHFGFGANQIMEVDLQVELIQVDGKVVAELNNNQDSERIGRILVKQVFGQAGQINQLLVRIPRFLLDKPDNQPIGLAVQLEEDWMPNQDSPAATITFTDVGPWTSTDLSWFQLEANNVALGIDETTKTKSLDVTMPNQPSAGIHYASLKIDDGNGFSLNLPISLSISDNQLANLDIRPRTVGEDILVRVGDTYQFSVIGKDVNGLNVDISGQTVNWIVDEPTKGGVSASGLFNAIAVGSVRVEASIGNVVGQSARIEIIEKILGDSTGTTPSIDYPDGQPDGQVDIFDLVNMANHWHQTEADTTASVKEFKDLDIAGKNRTGDKGGFDQVDKKIDIFDLVVLVDNYGIGLTPTLAAPAILARLPVLEGGSSDLQVVSTDNTSQSGNRVRTIIDQQIELDVLLNQVPNLYAYSYDLVYDQQKLDLITQEDGRPVFQNGSIFSTETVSSHSIVNQKSTEDGSQMASANVTTTRLGRQSINHQSGTLGRLQFVAKSIGLTQLQVKNLILVTDNGNTFTLTNQTYDLTVHRPVEHSQLDQNYPNPFNPETWIPFQLKSASPVVISIYDSTGKMIRELDLGDRVAGPHINRQEAAYWDGRNRWAEPVASGIYFYHLKTNDNVSTKKMTVLK